MTTTYAYPLAFSAALLTQACAPGQTDNVQECYPLDGNGDWLPDPAVWVDNYCGRGPTISEEPDQGRGVATVCVAAPPSGCDPCMWSAEEADDRLLEAIAATFEDADCPSGYEAERFVRGCFASWPERGECCFTAEYFTDQLICNPIPDEVP